MSASRALLLLALVAAAALPGAFAACVAGQDGCKACSLNGLRCKQCQTYSANDDTGEVFPAYGLTKAFTCVKCQPQGQNPEWCFACDGDNPTRCIKCNDWEFSEPLYVTKVGTCAKCAQGCLKCEDFTGRCRECGEGFFLARRQGVCVPCTDKNCADCKRGPAQCTRCMPGSGPFRGKCMLCSAFDKNCGSCDRRANVCTNCNTGFGVTHNGKCAPCAVQNCEGCWANARKCQECANGFTPSKDGRRCIPGSA